eukprot:gene26-192_t
MEVDLSVAMHGKSRIALRRQVEVQVATHLSAGRGPDPAREWPWPYCATQNAEKLATDC